MGGGGGGMPGMDMLSRGFNMGSTAGPTLSSDPQAQFQDLRAHGDQTFLGSLGQTIGGAMPMHPPAETPLAQMSNRGQASDILGMLMQQRMQQMQQGY